MSSSNENEKRTVKDNLRLYGHWLELGAVVLMYVAIGIMQVESGSVKINDFGNFLWLDWVLWGVTTFLPGFIAVFIYDALRKEGIKQGKELYPEVIRDYRTLLRTEKISTTKLRSEREYLRNNNGRNVTKNLITGLVVSFVTGSLVWEFSNDSLVKIFINLGMWAFIGFKSLNASRDYAEGELQEWYIREIGRLEEDMISSGRYLSEPKDITNSST